MYRNTHEHTLDCASTMDMCKHVHPHKCGHSYTCAYMCTYGSTTLQYDTQDCTMLDTTVTYKRYNCNSITAIAVQIALAIAAVVAAATAIINSATTTLVSPYYSCLF